MRRANAAFSMVEVVLAVALLGTVGITLVGLLGRTLHISRYALDDAEVTMLMENVQARLTLDPSWPGKNLDRYFDRTGAEVQKSSEGTYRVRFATAEYPNFKSRYVDPFRARVERWPQEELLSVWTLQRVRLSEGKPVAPEE